ncbi:MAG: hypothetical protein Kow00108_00610 [Calditrichia bacterium]
MKKLVLVVFLLSFIHTLLFAQITFTKRVIDNSTYTGVRIAKPGDINNDGYLDVVQLNTGSTNSVVALTSDGTPSDGGWGTINIETQLNFPGGRGLSLADFDADNYLDVIVSSIAGTGQVEAIYLNNSGTSFTVDPSYSVINSALPYVTTADINGDGDYDIFTADYLSNSVYMDANDGTGGFTDYYAIGAINFVNSIATGDVDGDGDLDVVASGADAGATGTSSYLYWFENNGTPEQDNWTGRAIVPDNSANYDGLLHLFLKDVDQDGALDVIVAAATAGNLIVLYNDGTPNDGGWTEQIVDGSASGVRSVAARDLDGDGDIDLMATNETADELAWYENDGSESFTKRSLSTLFVDARWVEPADMDNDGDPDLLAVAFVSGGNSDLSYWENEAEDLQTIASGGSSTFWNSKVSIDFVSDDGAGDVTVFYDSEDVPDRTVINPGDFHHLVYDGFYTITTTKGTYSADLVFSYSGLPGWIGIQDEADLRIAWYNPSNSRWELAGTSQIVDDVANTITVSGVSQFGKFTLGTITPDNSLPVALSSFSASTNDNELQISWTTSSELDIAGFKLLWSENGVNYHLLDSYISNDNLKSDGNSNNEKHYSLIYEIPEQVTDVIWIKWQVIALNGEVEQTKIMKVNIIDSPGNIANSFQVDNCYPNPFNPVVNIPVNIQGNQQHDLKINIFNIQGQKIYSEVHANIGTGSHVFTWNGITQTNESAQSGIYFITIQYDNMKQSRKVVLLK